MLLRVERIFQHLSSVAPAFDPSENDTKMWTTALLGKGCTDDLLIKAALDRLEDWQYANAPSVMKFIGWYREARREGLGLPSLDVCVEEISKLVIGHLDVTQLSPGAYTVYLRIGAYKAKRVSDHELERRVKAAYVLTSKEIDIHGAKVIKQPPALLEDQNSELKKHIEANRRPREPYSDKVKSNIDQLRKMFR